MPFYYRKNDNGAFDFEIAGSKKGWSIAALCWLSYMAYDARFRKSEKEYYPLHCCVTGEREVHIENHRFKVDGLVETPNKTYYLEFLGCR